MTTIITGGIPFFLVLLRMVIRRDV